MSIHALVSRPWKYSATAKYKRAFDDLCISQLINIFILFDIFVSFLCPVLFQLDCSLKWVAISYPRHRGRVLSLKISIFIITLNKNNSVFQDNPDFCSYFTIIIQWHPHWTCLEKFMIVSLLNRWFFTWCQQGAEQAVKFSLSSKHNVLSRSVLSNSLWPTWTIARQASLSMGILQARILYRISMLNSRGSSHIFSRGRTQVSHFAGRFFAIWATREASKMNKMHKADLFWIE